MTTTQTQPAGASDAAIAQLRNHQKQLDAEGCMVGVSRQALDEVLDALDALTSKAEGGNADVTTARQRQAEAIEALTGKREVCTCPSGDGSLRWPCPYHPPAQVAGSGGLPYAASLAKWCDVQADDPDNKDGAVTLLAIAETLRAAAKALAAQPAPVVGGGDELIGALDRMDALLDPKRKILKVDYYSGTMAASRDDMELIRAALSARPAVEGGPKTGDLIVGDMAYDD